MSSDYNANLIDRFYEAINRNDIDTIVDLINEMQEIKDPLFLHIIYNNYAKFKNTFISHYFTGAPAYFDQADAEPIAIKLLAEKDIKDTDFSFGLESLQKFNIFEPYYINKASEILYRIDLADKTYWFDFANLLAYLKKASALDHVLTKLEEILSSPEIHQDYRKTALYYFLRIQPSRDRFIFLIDNYQGMKSDQFDILISKEIIRWNGSLVKKLQEIILKNGCSRAKEIISEASKLKGKEEQKIEEKEINKFNNMQYVVDIIEIRNKINSYSKHHWGFNLFKERESIFKLSINCLDEPTFGQLCNDLRSVIISIDQENTQSHGLTEENIRKLGFTPSNSPLNNLYLFLHSKGVGNNEFYSFREINRITGLVGHPEKGDELIKLLHQRNLLKIYQEKNWSELHSQLLLAYREGLNNLLKDTEKLTSHSG